MGSVSSSLTRRGLAALPGLRAFATRAVVEGRAQRVVRGARRGLPGSRSGEPRPQQAERCIAADGLRPRLNAGR